jgi:hypothetical protein
MTFKDLKFSPPDYMGFSRAKLELPNGYGISVITGKYAYSDEGAYEVGILYNGHLCYDTPLTDDVLGYQSPSDIDAILAQLEKMT